MKLRCRVLGHDEYPHGETANGKGWWWKCRRCHEWTAYDYAWNEVDTTLSDDPRVREVKPGMFTAVYSEKERRELYSLDSEDNESN